MYPTTTTPSSMQEVSLISRFIQSPSKIHFGEEKRILTFVHETSNFGIWYASTYNFGLVGYTSGDVFTLGSCSISRCSKKQPIVSLSSREAQYNVNM
jgi:hypothetical protein